MTNALVPVVDAALAAFDAVAPRFLATRKSQRTMKTYGEAMGLYRAHCVAYGLDPLRLDAVIAYSVTKNALRGPLSAGTIRLRLKTVQSFLSWAYSVGLSPLRPEVVASSMTFPPARKLSPRDILTADEAAQMVLYAHTGKETLLVRIMLDGGLRVSEVLALTAGDIYTAMGRCYLHVASGKGDQERDVEIPPDLFRALRKFTDGWRDELRIFGRTDRVYAWRIVQRVADRAGLERHVTPHALRHTHAHHMRLADMPLEVLSARLGHASVETTKVYTRPAELAQAMRLPTMPWTAPKMHTT